MANTVGATMITMVEVVVIIMIVTGDVRKTVKLDTSILVHAKR